MDTWRFEDACELDYNAVEEEHEEGDISAWQEGDSEEKKAGSEGKRVNVADKRNVFQVSKTQAQGTEVGRSRRRVQAQKEAQDAIRSKS
ncbi:hypothetical protein NDU88_007527 [Pleurodeles waltl]|uniref:Uncharacterized protein n=1 Tax=Pleurodeles waltl TaxID=8319 RepID=A0AAV7PLK0_PLEWA|nr:hypothetical protein NDU88_007527 [Pleurodeles waltl]